MRVPVHAAVFETVASTKFLKCSHLRSLVNGVLRQFLLRKEEIASSGRKNYEDYLHPYWLLRRIKVAWPGCWRDIVRANNEPPPMWIRVNSRYNSREAWIKGLASGVSITKSSSSDENKYALLIDPPIPVEKLHGFEKGWASVQDLSAQRCAILLDPQNNERILDLCAAPGGKTFHILELAPSAEVVAVDINLKRLLSMKKDAKRLNLKIQMKHGDGLTPQKWCTGTFDRILLDAPCSATGVIRRHPDIKWLRRDRDIEKLASVQYSLLEAIWPYLNPGGVILYVTCSILPEENFKQIKKFLSFHKDASAECLRGNNEIGWQTLPSINGGDGFFYAKLIRSQN
jgi:16S rRNA (cytosine967-C5)-methyltransferase